MAKPSVRPTKAAKPQKLALTKETVKDLSIEGTRVKGGVLVRQTRACGTGTGG